MNSRKRWQFPTALGLIVLTVCILLSGLMLVVVSQRNEVFYYIRGVSYHNGGRLDHAIEDYSQAIKKNPDYAAAYYKRGEACYSIGELELAAQDYEIYLELAPDASNRDEVAIRLEEIKSELSP